MIAVLDGGITVIDGEKTFFNEGGMGRGSKMEGGEGVETPEVSLRSGKLEMLGGVVL